jgi:hypothetical protein
MGPILSTGKTRSQSANLVIAGQKIKYNELSNKHLIIEIKYWRGQNREYQQIKWLTACEGVKYSEKLLLGFKYL